MLIASPNDPGFLDASPLFAHIRSAPHLYKALMGLNGGGAPGVLRACFETRARKALSLDLGPKGLKRAAICRFVASSLLAIIECWLEEGSRETPQQLQALFAELVSPGVRACRNVGLRDN